MSAASDIGLCGKVSMGLYGGISKIRENFAVLDAFGLILAFASGAPWEFGRFLLFSRAKVGLTIQV
jgi:hypothetical protein